MSRMGGLTEALAAVSDYQQKGREKRLGGEKESERIEKSSRKDKPRRSKDEKKEKRRKKKEERDRRRERKEKHRIKKESREKSSKHRRRTPSSSDSDGGSDGSAGSSSNSLDMEENEVHQKSRKRAQLLLQHFPDLQSDLVQLLENVDRGQAVDVSGVPDATLREGLQGLLRSLGLRRSSLGLFALRQGRARTLATLASVLQPAAAAGRGQQEEEGGLARDAAQGPGTSSGSPAGLATRATPTSQGGTADQGGGEEGPAVRGSSPPAGAEGGAAAVAAGEGGAAAAAAAGQQQQEEEGAAGPGPKRRVMGPAMPSAETLAAAAKLTDAVEALRRAEEELEEQGPIVGPPPPAAVLEAENATEAERFEEVARILAPDTNAYAILGVKQDVLPPELKKRYWKLSLLVHPDKCSHPQAQEAFTSLNQALKDLQDPAKARSLSLSLSLLFTRCRAVVDGQLEAKQARKEYEAELKARREAAEREVHDIPPSICSLCFVWSPEEEAEEGDAELLDGTAGREPARDTWMTELPPERSAAAVAPQTNTFFSREEKRGRGDASAWTDTPQQKAEKAKQLYLDAYQQAMLPGPSQETVALFEQAKASKAALLMDQYNENKRAKTLLEKHQEALAEGAKKRRRKEKEEAAFAKLGKKGAGASRGAAAKGGGVGGPGEASKEWEANHPWRPWDRDKDLSAGPKAMKLDKDNMAGGLSSRFGSSNPGGRSFL
eukprot:jgi/Mesen1/3058/ME000018S02364